MQPVNTPPTLNIRNEGRRRPCIGTCDNLGAGLHLGVRSLHPHRHIGLGKGIARKGRFDFVARPSCLIGANAGGE